jgi:hypothetical protein
MIKPAWYPFDDGSSIGTEGSEKGVILCDEEHSKGARITLERDGSAPFAITCGIYGWMVHTRFFSNLPEAQQAFDEMKAELGNIMHLIPPSDDPRVDAKMIVAEEAIDRFIEQFP